MAADYLPRDVLFAIFNNVLKLPVVREPDAGATRVPQCPEDFDLPIRLSHGPLCCQVNSENWIGLSLVNKTWRQAALSFVLSTSLQLEIPAEASEFCAANWTHALHPVATFSQLRTLTVVLVIRRPDNAPNADSLRWSAPEKEGWQLVSPVVDLAGECREHPGCFHPKDFSSRVLAAISPGGAVATAVGRVAQSLQRLTAMELLCSTGDGETPFPETAVAAVHALLRGFSRLQALRFECPGLVPLMPSPLGSPLEHVGPGLLGLSLSLSEWVPDAAQAHELGERLRSLRALCLRLATTSAMLRDPEDYGLTAGYATVAAALRLLPPLKQLTQLSLSLPHDANFPHHELALLTAGLQLRTLDLRVDSAAILLHSREAAAGLAQLLRQQAPCLRTLHLYALTHSIVGNRGVGLLLPELSEAVAGCTQLQALSLGDDVPAALLPALFRRMACLESFEETIKFSGPMSDTQLQEVVASCPLLRRFHSARLRLNSRLYFPPAVHDNLQLSMPWAIQEWLFGMSMPQVLRHVELSMRKIGLFDVLQHLATFTTQLQSLVLVGLRPEPALAVNLEPLLNIRSLRVLELRCRRAVKPALQVQLRPMLQRLRLEVGVEIVWKGICY